MRSTMSRLNKKTWALIALILVFAALGAGAGLGVLSHNGNVTAHELSASADSKKTELLNGLANGQILYWKMEEYEEDRHGSWESNVPDRLVTENWITQRMDGGLKESVSISRDVAGTAVRYGTYMDGRAVTTYVDSEEEIVINISAHGKIATWFDGMWGRVDSGYDREGESTSRVTVDGKEKAIFKWEYAKDENQPELGHKRRKIEMVVSDPLLRRYTSYKVDPSGTETLISDLAITEYRLLPVGSKMPSVP